MFVLMIVGDTNQAEMLVRTIQCISPNSRIIQVSDDRTVEIPGISRVERFPYNVSNLMEFRLKAFANLKLTHTAAYIDTDMLLMRDFSVSDLLGSEDALVCERTFGKDDLINISYLGLNLSEYEGKTFGEVYPYLASFTVTRDYRFWMRCLDELMKLDEKFRHWYGDQEALRIVANDPSLRVAKIPEKIVSCLPEHKNLTSEAIFVHYKGIRRKPQMVEDYRNLMNLFDK